MSEASIWFPNLGITLKNVGKSFDVFGIEIAFYGVVIALAMLLGITLVTKVAQKTGQNPEMYFDVSLITIVIALIGARLYYVVFSWDNYKNNLPEIFNIRGGGLAIYGGVLAGMASVFVFSRIKKTNYLQMGDTICPGLILGQMIGRWGNFFNREAFGGYTDGLFAMAIPKNMVRADEITAEMAAHLQVVDGIEWIQVHPTFLYESLWNLGVLLLLLFMTRHKKFHGQIFCLYLAGYGLGRFWIEGLRTDQLLIPGIGFPVSQALSAVLVLIAVILPVILKKRRRNPQDVQSRVPERRN